MFQDRCYERDVDINNNFFAENMSNNIDMDVNMNPMMANDYQGMSCQQPMVEPMQERVVNRTIMHEVPHVCPIRTRIINNHVYRHTYSPSYSCCSQDTVSNVQCGSCCGFK